MRVKHCRVSKRRIACVFFFRVSNPRDDRTEESPNSDPSRDDEVAELIEAADPRLAASLESLIAVEESYFAAMHKTYSPPTTMRAYAELR